MPYGMEYRFGQFRSAVLVLYPPSSLYLPSPSTGRTGGETEKKQDVLGSVQHRLATAEIWVCYQYCFLPEAKT